MKQPLIHQVQNAYKKKGYKYFDGIDNHGIFKPYDLNICGIRANNRDQSADEFDDLLVVTFKTDVGNTKLLCWPWTTDPGKAYLENPMNPLGTFIMLPGQYLGAYKIGKHHTQDALVQIGVLKGYRDNNKNKILDCNPGQLFEGNNFGVNIHHKENDSENIGLGSAGCQVSKSTQHYNEFFHLVKIASGIWGDIFSYTLFEENDVFNE